MKLMTTLKLSISLGLLLHVGITKTLNEEEAGNILGRLNSFDKNAQSDWVSSGPTKEDILAADKINNVATKGSFEEKIIHAAKDGDHKSVEKLIVAGVNIKAKNDQGRTALMAAAERGNSKIVTMLLDAGADVKDQDKLGWTALCLAVDKNHVEVAKILIARGAGIDKNCEDFFVSSVFKGNIEMVKALADQGACISCDVVNAAYSVVDFRNREMVDVIKQLKLRCSEKK